MFKSLGNIRLTHILQNVNQSVKWNVNQSVKSTIHTYPKFTKHKFLYDTPVRRVNSNNIQSHITQKYNKVNLYPLMKQQYRSMCHQTTEKLIKCDYCQCKISKQDSLDKPSEIIKSNDERDPLIQLLENTNQNSSDSNSKSNTDHQKYLILFGSYIVGSCWVTGCFYVLNCYNMGALMNTICLLLGLFPIFLLLH